MICLLERSRGEPAAAPAAWPVRSPGRSRLTPLRDLAACCAARFQFGLCRLRVISDRAGRRHTTVHVRFTPKADKQRRASVCPLRADRDLAHCSKRHRCSIIWSVRAASVGGTSRLVRKDSRNERYGIFGRDRADHSALMPANLITLAHFSVSAAMCLPKSVGGPPNGVAPRSASRACILGSDRAALIALLRVSITSAGVLLGAQKPPQKLAS